MDWTLVITALISMVSAIAVACISRATKKSNDASNSAVEGQVTSIERRLDKVILELEDNNLRTMRLDLLHAIETDPNNVMVILELAQKYFVDMKGNCYMSKVFQEWANDHDVNITGLFNQG